MLIIDAHLDLGWNAVLWDRDLTKNVAQIRTAERGMAEKGRRKGTVALPELRHGNVALAFGTTNARFTGRAQPYIDFHSQEMTYAVAKSQLAYYRALEHRGFARVITDRASLDRHMAEWQSPQMRHAPLGLVMSMESADPILSPAQLNEWWNDGVRAIGPAHYGRGVYASGTGTEGGLTALGRELVAAMDKLGIALDLTHLADEAFWEAIQIHKGTVLASHNNCRALVPAQRQFSDDQLRAIIERDGVIGVAFDAWMLQPGWVIGETTNENVSLENVVNHIDHICQLAGNANHVGIGSDLDGGFGLEQCPRDLDTIADLQKIPPILRQRGYTETDVEKIMHGNWLRLLRRVL